MCSELTGLRWCSPGVIGECFQGEETALQSGSHPKNKYKKSYLAVWAPEGDLWLGWCGVAKMVF